MNKFVKLGTIIIGLLLVAACSTSLKNNVTRFHQLPTPSGETIEVIALDPTLQQSIEFGTYAQMVGRALGNVGYAPPVGNRSQLVAEIAYSITTLQDNVIENRSPISVGMGVGGGSRRGTSMGVGISTGFGSSENQARYVTTLSMNIIDLTTGERIYEGYVESINKNPNLAQMMPFMIDALFQDFPGTSGTTNIVEFSPE